MTEKKHESAKETKAAAAEKKEKAPLTAEQQANKDALDAVLHELDVAAPAADDKAAAARAPVPAVPAKVQTVLAGLKEAVNNCDVNGTKQAVKDFIDLVPHGGGSERAMAAGGFNWRRVWEIISRIVPLILDMVES